MSSGLDVSGVDGELLGGLVARVLVDEQRHRDVESVGAEELDDGAHVAGPVSFDDRDSKAVEVPARDVGGALHEDAVGDAFDREYVAGGQRFELVAHPPVHDHLLVGRQEASLRLHELPAAADGHDASPVRTRSRCPASASRGASGSARP